MGTDFGNYVKYKRPKRRGGKPILNARSWPTTHDPWRGISRTAFTLDYIKTYPVVHEADGSDPKAVEDKMLEMNSYDENDNPKYGHDVYVQRLNCYVQHKETVTDVPLTPDIENPYNKPRREGKQSYVPDLNTLDNGNCIIIFENSESGSIDDTLITARQEWESRWRRLPFYLALESRDVSNDDRMALQCMKLILSDVWKGVTDNWESFIDICNSHVSILEDRIYEMPADESRAPELWANAAFNLKIERLMALHTNLVGDVQLHLKEFVTEGNDDTWIEAAPSDMERVSSLVQEDLVKRLANLNDLLYKSVEIRDSRHSLTLNLSMWRLSWITFIFLPLTFMASFFGMNTDTFSKDPSIKWYFIAAVPLMICVIIGWYMFKHFLATQRQTPYSRGIYEGFFHELAVEYPSLWSRVGPRKAIRPKGFFDNIRWRLILFWNDSKKTIRAGPNEDSTYDDLGVWSRLKRQLTRRWTAQLRSTSDYEPDEAGLPLQDYSSTEITELAQGAPHAKETAQGTDLPGGMLKVAMPTQFHTQILQGSDSTQRPSSQGSSAGRNSGVLVEEERPNWLRDYALKGRQSSEARRASFQQLFSPMHTEDDPTAAVPMHEAGNAEGPGAEKPPESQMSAQK